MRQMLIDAALCGVASTVVALAGLGFVWWRMGKTGD